jgi:hypothetical protein
MTRRKGPQAEDYRLMCEKLARALAIYAKEANWAKDDWGVPAVFEREYGKPGTRARATLKRYERFMSDESQGADA